MVRREIAIGLGVVCIILAIVLVSASVYASILLNDDTSSYNSLKTAYSNYQSSHSHTDTDYNSLQSQLSAAQSQQSTNDIEIVSQFQSQLATANGINSLQLSTVWINDQTVSQPNEAYSLWNFSASYAGYVSVSVLNSTVTGTHVEAIYSADGVNFNQEITVSVGYSAVFPVLPSSTIQIGVGNGLAVGNGATETVTITYHY